jgi:outer membrane receptor protein involved in Fe transport
VLSSDIDPATNGLVIADFYSFTNATGPVQSANVVSQDRSIGLYGSARIDWKRQVFLELTARNDWTSTLAPGNRSFFYPSANLSWVFTEPLKNLDFVRKVLTYGKLRGGYASVGKGATAYQNNNSAYTRATVSTAFSTINLPFNGIAGYTYQNAIGNPELKPERTNSFEAGIELAFFRDRISLDATYYVNNSTDQILTTPVAPSSGFTGKVVNLGDLTNKGIELAMRFTPLKTSRGLRWDLFGTYTKNRSEVTRLPEGVTRVAIGGASGITAYAAIGQPYGAFYATDVLTDSIGRVVVDSASGTPKIAPNVVFKGTFQPKFIASWGTTISYKGFSFNVLFDTKQGGKFYSGTKDIMGFGGISEETESRDDQIWPNSVYVNAQGQYVANTTPYSVYNWYGNSVVPDGQHVIDASYVKLREASLTYALPQNWIKRTPFGSASFSIFGNNLFIWTAKENKYVDPEQNSAGATNLQGFDFRSNPSLRNYGATLRVTF